MKINSKEQCLTTFTNVNFLKICCTKNGFCNGKQLCTFLANYKSINLPVTITVLILACLSCVITGVVSGFTLFSVTKNPRKVNPFSTCSLLIEVFKIAF